MEKCVTRARTHAKDYCFVLLHLFVEYIYWYDFAMTYLVYTSGSRYLSEGFFSAWFGQKTNNALE